MGFLFLGDYCLDPLSLEMPKGDVLNSVTLSVFFAGILDFVKMVVVVASHLLGERIK